MAYQFCDVNAIKETDIIFLCGTSFNKNSKYDKRVILKNFLEDKYPEKNILILEEHFSFGGNGNKYLKYDEIFMKNLNDIEMLTASFASKIFIIHESISTGAELASFASKEFMHNKICLLVPDSTGIEEQKLSAFLRLAYFRQDSLIEKITFYPETYSFPISENHQEIRTNFPRNIIPTNFGLKIIEFINRNNSDMFDNIKFRKFSYGKPNNNRAVVSYATSETEGKVYVSTHVVFYQLIALFQVEEFKREVRMLKKLTDHINYIQNFYKETMMSTICELSGKHIKNISIFIKELDLPIRNVLAYSLYMFQALGYIKIETIDERKKIVISNIFNEVVSTYKELILKKKSYVVLEK